jgi:hypothetical protein
MLVELILREAQKFMRADFLLFGELLAAAPAAAGG